MCQVYECVSLVFSFCFVGGGGGGGINITFWLPLLADVFRVGHVEDDVFRLSIPLESDSARMDSACDRFRVRYLCLMSVPVGSYTLEAVG